MIQDFAEDSLSRRQSSMADRTTVETQPQSHILQCIL